MRGKDRVVIGALRSLRIGVDERGGQPRHGVQEAVLGVDCYLMRLDRAGRGIDDYLTFSPQLVANPPQPHLADVEDSGVERRTCSVRSTSSGSTASIRRR